MNKYPPPEESNWSKVANRFMDYRISLELNRQQLAEALDISLNQMSRLESGQGRKSFGNIFEICRKCDLDPEWLLLGKSKEPLKFKKGAGVRRTEMRKNAEDGTMDGAMLEFVLAIDEFKRKNHKNFPTSSDIFQLILYLGYRKVAEQADSINDLKGETC